MPNTFWGSEVKKIQFLLSRHQIAFPWTKGLPAPGFCPSYPSLRSPSEWLIGLTFSKSHGLLAIMCILLPCHCSNPFIIQFHLSTLARIWPLDNVTLLTVRTRFLITSQNTQQTCFHLHTLHTFADLVPPTWQTSFASQPVTCMTYFISLEYKYSHYFFFFQLTPRRSYMFLLGSYFPLPSPKICTRIPRAV